MAILQTNGSAITGTSTKNNGGSMVGGGSVSSGVVVSRPSSKEDVGVFGSTVIDSTDSSKALSSGVFSYNNNRPVAKKTTSTISGVSNVFLLSGADYPAGVKSIHRQLVKVEGEGFEETELVDGVRTRRSTLAIRTNHFDIYTGKFDENYPVVAADVFGNDDAATPSRDVPGELTYIGGKLGQAILKPVNTTYSKKTG